MSEKPSDSQVVQVCFNCITVLPEMFTALTNYGVIGRAFERGLVSLRCWNPRDQTTDNYRRVDDRSYGGGPGMVMLAEPLDKTLAAIASTGPQRVFMLSPQGRALNHQRVQALVDLVRGKQVGAAEAPTINPAITLLCGRYEGIDQRFLDKHHIEEISLGDFVVSGGELPAMLVIDAIVRLLPGVLNDEGSAQADSFATGLLDHPHYTRPELWQGIPVPPVLLTGDHKKIDAWRREQSLRLTRLNRPDLLQLAQAEGLLSKADLAALRRFEQE